jgi:hypothetical protein
MRNLGFLTRGAIAALLLTAAGGTCGWAASAPLVTPSQTQNDRLALSLRHDPVVEAARRKVLADWGALPQAQLPDGKATLNAAVEEATYMALRSAVADPSRPQVLWTEAPAYAVGALHVPSGREGDSPDRIYRFAAMDPRYSYVIHGHRDARPSLDEFSFEACTPPAAVGKALFHLSSHDIDIAPDGSFTVTADATPANGRRNHLTLPPGTANVLIRDTLVDWSSQLPNDLTIERVGGPAAAPRSKAELAQETATEIGQIDALNLPFLQLVWKAPANQITPRVRPLAWGMPGSGLAFNRFSLKPGEALVVTLDPLGGKYLGFTVGDLWMRSVNYWSRTGSLNNHQAKPNPDGTITYVLAAKDPGVTNWLDTGGLRDGLMTVRWEGLPANADIAHAAKGAQVVPIAQLAAALPNVPRIGPGARQQILAQRKAAFAQRTAVE